MSSSFDPRFLAALTLPERLALLRAADRPLEPPEANLQLGSRRLALWKGQRAFAQPGLFEARLRAQGLSEKEILDLLASDPVMLAGLVAEPPSWLVSLKRTWRQRRGAPEAPGLPAAAVRDFPPFWAFRPFIEPLVKEAVRQLRRRVTALVRRRPRPSLRLETFLPRLVTSLQLRLCQQASRALVLELHLARLQGTLGGSTPKARFKAFVARLGEPRARTALLDRYPVLARHLAAQAELWTDAVSELLERFLEDWPEIHATLLPGERGEDLVQVSMAEGDRHRGGRSVSILSFASGAKLVYKPRALAVEAHFQDLLRWLNARGDHPELRTLEMLDRGTYGWMEFVAARPCSSFEELERFYVRQGAYLALLHALEATDFHGENLIAAGEHPVLIDLESLFHPRPEADTEIEWNILSRSVLRVGLLPRRIVTGGESEGIDLSGLGTPPGQLVPHGVAEWEDPGTDMMRFVRRRKELPGSQNRPTLEGREVGLQEFAGAIERGFESMYRLLLRHREELAGDRGLLRAFQEDEIRVLLRPTWVYAQLLEDSFHPDFLHDALDRDRFFDWLWAADWGHPKQSAILAAEREDLLAGDIPCFSSRPGSNDLFGSRGERLLDLFATSALAEVENKLVSLSERDLELQLSVIRSSLKTLPPIDDLRQRPTARGGHPGQPFNPESLLRQACSIGDRLSLLALERDGEVSWLSLTSRGGRHLTLEPLSIDLYHGLSGVALFLAYLAATCGEDRYRELARAAMERVCRRIGSGHEGPFTIGGFTGLGGVIYALTHLGILWNDRRLLASAEEYAALAASAIETDEALDVLSGAAGCIGALLPLYRQTGSPALLDIARACGDRILARAVPQRRGLGWLTSISGAPLAGFAHGNAGFAWALLHLAEATGDRRYRDYAQGALEYERTLFSPAERNWPDLRTFPGSNGKAGSQPPQFMVAWCHGAPGIGMARLTAPRGSWDEECRNDLDAALETTSRAGFGRTHSLCHGDLGNLDLLVSALRVDGFEEWEPHCQTLAARVVGDLAANGLVSGIPGGVETPGLMLGLAGIGFGLLRLASPVTIPSVLAMEGPRSSAGQEIS